MKLDDILSGEGKLTPSVQRRKQAQSPVCQLASLLMVKFSLKFSIQLLLVHLRGCGYILIKKLDKLRFFIIFKYAFRKKWKSR